MKTVPRVREPDTSALILSRNARYRSPSLAGTRQFTVHDRNRISVASLTPTRMPAPFSRSAQRSAADREAGVEHEERGEQEQLVRAGDAVRELREVDVERDPEDQDQEDQRDAERDDRPRLPQPGAERHLAAVVIVGAVAAAAGASGAGRPGAAERAGRGTWWWRRRRSRAAVHSCAGTRVCRRADGDPPVAPGAVDELCDGCEGPDDIRGPAGHKLDVGQGGEQPFGGRRVPVDAPCTRRRPRRRCARRTRRRRAGPSRARTRPPARCPSPPTTRALCASTQSTSGAIASRRGSLSIEPRKRSNGCGMPDQPALRRGPRRSSSRGGQPGRDGALEEQRDQVAVGGLDLLADDDREPVRAPRRERAAPPRSGRGR